MLLNIEAPPAAIAELERTMRINEDVIRYLTIRVEAHDEGPSVIMQSRGSRDDRQRRSSSDRERYGEGRDGASERADWPRAAQCRKRWRHRWRVNPVAVLARGAGARRPFFRRRKSCPFSGPNAPKIDYKDVKLLQRFVSERGKIVPSRITAVSTKRQARACAGDQTGAVSRPRFPTW